MSVKIRLRGTADACRQAAERLAAVFQVLSVSDPYPDRGHSVLVRVYIEAELPAGRPGEPGTRELEAGQ
jgi:hypothetical protein